MMNKNVHKLIELVLVASLVNLGSVYAQTRDDVHATPQRPSFSTSTTTTYPGWLELEAGVSLDEHVFDSPLLLKMGVSKNAELFAGVSPIVNVSNGHSESGPGDVTVGGRIRFKDEAAQGRSLAGQFSIKLPTANEKKGLGSGEFDYNFLLILSQSLENMSLDINSGFTVAGDSKGRTDEQFTGILTLSKPLGTNFSGFSEIVLNHSFEFDQTTWMGSGGASLTLNPRFILDAAIIFNISNAPFDIRFLTGATFTFAKIL